MRLVPVTPKEFLPLQMQVIDAKQSFYDLFRAIVGSKDSAGSRFAMITIPVGSSESGDYITKITFRDGASLTVSKIGGKRRTADAE